MSFYEELKPEDYDLWGGIIANTTDEDVRRALATDRRTVCDFAALISPRAASYLPAMAAEAERLTRARFGQTVSMYLPLYLSNLCSNCCRYCGFAASNRFRRRILDADEVVQECEAIRHLGYETILVVTGESVRGGMDYFREMIPIVKRYSSYLMMEVQPLDIAEYIELRELGADCVCVYQETYHEPTYRENHLHGKKTDMRYRMETPERLGEAGMDKIGMGILLGLAEFRTDACMLARHIAYMRKRYWRSKISLSFPRLRPAEGGFTPPYPVSERELVQYICAFRLFDPELEISISTRESAKFRDAVVPIAINSISAGSSTQPGGYAVDKHDVPQFVINDSRSSEEIAAHFRDLGLDVIWHSSRIGG
ncbi:MAG: 2-iminoacetate synthase ThiH [Succinivibrionaceae bacterium]|nr:2-iminoacetate synthase ThiH [Succinivibrionaceae bacterium]